MGGCAVTVPAESSTVREACGGAGGGGTLRIIWKKASKQSLHVELEWASHSARKLRIEPSTSLPMNLGRRSG